MRTKLKYNAKNITTNSSLKFYTNKQTFPFRILFVLDTKKPLAYRAINKGRKHVDVVPGIANQIYLD